MQALKALIPYSKSAHKMEAVAHIVKIIFTATADGEVFYLISFFIDLFCSKEL